MENQNNPENREKSPEKPEAKPEERKYAILMETSGEEYESWYYFIKYQGNEEALNHLQNQLSQVDWYILDDLSTFDLELDYLVSERTAKEMTKVDLNHTSFHRKFDGKMKKINLGFKRKDSNKKKMSRAFKVLGYGQIEDYVSDEDIDEEDLVTDTDTESESEESSTESSTSESSLSESKKEPAKNKKLGPLPASVLEKPRLARARFRKHKK